LLKRYPNNWIGFPTLTNTPFFDQKPYTLNKEGDFVALLTRRNPWDPRNTFTAKEAWERRHQLQRITRSVTSRQGSRQGSGTNTPNTAAQALPETPAVEDTAFKFTFDTDSDKDNKPVVKTEPLPASLLFTSGATLAALVTSSSTKTPKTSTSVAVPTTLGNTQGQGSQTGATAGTQQSTQSQTTNTMSKDERGPPMAAPTPFNGTWKNTQKFIHECNLYINGKPNSFTTNGNTDNTLKIAFMLSYMNKGIASLWVQRYLSRFSRDTDMLQLIFFCLSSWTYCYGITPSSVFKYY
jgi:hypothetical protein